MQSNAGGPPLKVKTNLREVAYRSFTQSLLASRIRPGQFLSQRELVAITGAPLTAIREAIPRLEAERLIETVPQRGLQVARVDLKMIREVFQLWGVLARAGAERFAATASREQIAELQSTHDALLLRARHSPDGDLAEDDEKLDRAFHDQLVGALGNDIVADLHRVNRIKIGMIRIDRGGPDRHSIISSAEERLAIIGALKLRDAALAAKAVDLHIEVAWRRALAIPAGGLDGRALRAARGKGMAAA